MPSCMLLTLVSLLHGYTADPKLHIAIAVASKCWAVHNGSAWRLVQFDRGLSEWRYRGLNGSSKIFAGWALTRLASLPGRSAGSSTGLEAAS